MILARAGARKTTSLDAQRRMGWVDEDDQPLLNRRKQSQAKSCCRLGFADCSGRSINIDSANNAHSKKCRESDKSREKSVEFIKEQRHRKEEIQKEKDDAEENLLIRLSAPRPTNCTWCNTVLAASGAARGCTGPTGEKNLCTRCHQRFSKGLCALPPTEGWKCTWCDCAASATRYRTKGPDGEGTLCQGCGHMYRNGLVSPKLWRCAWCDCDQTQTKYRAMGPAGKGTLCDQCGHRHHKGLGPHLPIDEWECLWCHCSAHETNRRLQIDGIALCVGCGNRYTKGVVPSSKDFQCAWCPSTASESFWCYNGPPGKNTLCNTCCKRGKPPELVPVDWTCSWCNCTLEESMTNTRGEHQSSRRCKGPDGPGTLCKSCGGSYANGMKIGPRCVGFYAGGDWKCDWCGCLPTSAGHPREGPAGAYSLCGSILVEPVTLIEVKLADLLNKAGTVAGVTARHKRHW